MAEQENKHDKFKRLASKRVNDLMKKIKNIGNLSSANYEYSDEEVEKIFLSLQEALDNAKAKFQKGKAKKDSFQL